MYVFIPLASHPPNNPESPVGLRNLAGGCWTTGFLVETASFDLLACGGRTPPLRPFGAARDLIWVQPLVLTV